MANSSTKCNHNCFPELSTLTNGGFSPLLGLEEINYSSLIHGDDFVVPQTCQDTTSLVFSNENHHHHHPHDGRMELPALPDCNMVDYFSGGGLDGLVGFDTVGYPQMNVAINGYTSSVLNCSPSAYHVANNLGSWQGNRSGQKMITTHASGVGENTTSRVGRYSVEERRDRILRYLKKRNQRNFNKTIKYVCRKTLADRRARVRGRFAKNNEDDQFNTNNSSPINNEATTISSCSYYDYANHDHQKKEEGEEWLQEAIASLMMYNVNMAAPYHHVPQWQPPGGLSLR